jgi:DNA-binding transcriptional ArsR family regulator
LPIRFRLPAEHVDRVAFAYSPLLEALLSLHVLVEPKHHPLQHPWVREMRRLDPQLKRAIQTFSFVYRNVFPDCFLPTPDDELPTFEAELERLRALDPTTIAYELTRPLYDHGGREPRDPHLDDPRVREIVLERAAAHSRNSPDVLRRLFDDPQAVAAELASLFERYWHDAFAAEWARVEPQLAETVALAGRQIAEEGLYALLLALAPQLRVDVVRGEFGIDVPHDHLVEISPGKSLVLVPSVYVWPHVRVNCDEPWPLTLVYATPLVAGRARRELPPPELLRVLRALGDATRLRALALIAERPRSTQELAPLIGMSEAGLSKHLRVLAEAGLVQTRREGYYVLYSLVPDRVRALAGALPSLIEPQAR